MKKIPTLFQRDWEGDRSRVLPEPNPDASWVLAGEGVATRKYDGTACMIAGGHLFKRYELKPGREAPALFVPADTVDAETGKQPGWVPVREDDPADRWFIAALRRPRLPRRHLLPYMPDGTYELVGPKVQGNPEGYEHHELIRHADAERVDAPRDFDGLAAWLAENDVEGVVWHHPDGRMAKIKARDFGIRRSARATEAAGSPSPNP